MKIITKWGICGIIILMIIQCKTNTKQQQQTFSDITNIQYKTEKYDPIGYPLDVEIEYEKKMMLL
jgi:hypothetical protein